METNQVGSEESEVRWCRRLQHGADAVGGERRGQVVSNKPQKCCLMSWAVSLQSHTVSFPKNDNNSSSATLLIYSHRLNILTKGWLYVILHTHKKKRMGMES